MTVVPRPFVLCTFLRNKYLYFEGHRNTLAVPLYWTKAVNAMMSWWYHSCNRHVLLPVTTMSLWLWSFVVRLARGRDEWESAALQNANTKCNGLLPIWGPQVIFVGYSKLQCLNNNRFKKQVTHREGLSCVLGDLIQWLLAARKTNRLLSYMIPVCQRQYWT